MTRSRMSDARSAGDRPADETNRQMSPISGELFAVLPSLRNYARFLTRNRHDSDDLVQDSIVRMLAAADRFKPGTNFRAWAFTILRNCFLTEFVVKKRRLVCLDETDMDSASTPPTQTQGLELQDLRGQLRFLSRNARLALARAAEKDVPYETIAKDAGCSVNTIKSRVHRGRLLLRKRLQVAYN